MRFGFRSVRSYLIDHANPLRQELPEKQYQTMPQLHRLTTEYSETEDRIRISGLDEDDDVHVLWLTQRLTNLLIATLVKNLEKLSSASGNADKVTTELVQGFEQHNAASQITLVAPVIATKKNTEWLIQSIDVNQNEDMVFLVLKGSQEQESPIAFDQVQLRQWLAICFSLFKKSLWPMDVWPSWMSEEAKPVSGDVPSSVH